MDVRKEWLKEELPEWFLELELGIDPKALDEVAAGQAKLVMECSMVVAWARGRRMAAKMALQQVESEAYVRLRRRIEESGGKPTEAQLGRLVPLEDDYAAAYRELIKWEFVSRYAEGVFEAVRERGANMRELARLYTAGYFTA